MRSGDVQRANRARGRNAKSSGKGTINGKRSLPNERSQPTSLSSNYAPPWLAKQPGEQAAPFPTRRFDKLVISNVGQSPTDPNTNWENGRELKNVSKFCAAEVNETRVAIDSELRRDHSPSASSSVSSGICSDESSRSELAALSPSPTSDSGDNYCQSDSSLSNTASGRSSRICRPNTSYRALQLRRQADAVAAACYARHIAALQVYSQRNAHLFNYINQPSYPTCAPGVDLQVYRSNSYVAPGYFFNPNYFVAQPEAPETYLPYLDSWHPEPLMCNDGSQCPRFPSPVLPSLPIAPDDAALPQSEVKHADDATDSSNISASDDHTTESTESENTSSKPCLWSELVARSIVSKAKSSPVATASGASCKEAVTPFTKSTKEKEPAVASDSLDSSAVRSLPRGPVRDGAKEAACTEKKRQERVNADVECDSRKKECPSANARSLPKPENVRECEYTSAETVTKLPSDPNSTTVIFGEGKGTAGNTGVSNRSATRTRSAVCAKQDFTCSLPAERYSHKGSERCSSRRQSRSGSSHHFELPNEEAAVDTSQYPNLISLKEVWCGGETRRCANPNGRLKTSCTSVPLFPPNCKENVRFPRTVRSASDSDARRRHNFSGFSEPTAPSLLALNFVPAEFRPHEFMGGTYRYRLLRASDSNSAYAPVETRSRPLRETNRGEANVAVAGEARTALPLYDQIQLGALAAVERQGACGSMFSQNGVFQVSRMDVLSEQIFHFHTEMAQKELCLERKLQLRDMLNSSIAVIFPQSGVYVVGSSLNGFGTNSSDLDLCLMLSSKDIDQRTDAVVVLNMVQEVLSRLQWIRELQLILAKVPILRIKFFEPFADITVDLNANNSVCIRNTHLLYYYSLYDWRVKPLVSVVKEWARRKDINNANRSSFTSYSLVLMVIHYLQCGIEPQILPSLQYLFPKRFNAKSDVRSLNISMPLDKPPPLETKKSDKSSLDTKKRVVTLGELLIGFLEYFAFKFDYVHDAISVRKGAKIQRSTVARQRSPFQAYNIAQWNCICIEEPFTLSNTAHSVHDQMIFDAIREAFAAGFRELDASRDLLAFLDVRPICVNLSTFVRPMMQHVVEVTPIASTGNSAEINGDKEGVVKGNILSASGSVAQKNVVSDCVNDGSENEKHGEQEELFVEDAKDVDEQSAVHIQESNSTSEDDRSLTASNMVLVESKNRKASLLSELDMEPPIPRRYRKNNKKKARNELRQRHSFSLS